MTERADFLLEIFTEELPPLALESLSRALLEQLLAGVDEAGLAHEAGQALNSPRRLAVLIPALQTRQAAREVHRRGPAVAAAFDDGGKPTRAAEGFARSCGVSVDALQRQQTDKGEWLAYSYTEPGRETAELLPELVEQALSKLPIPRRMRWGAGEESFVRPVHGVLMLLGEAVVPATILGQRSDRITRGHRFMGAARLEIARPEEYIPRLREEGWVLVDPAARRERVEQQISQAGKQAGGRPVVHEHVLHEVCALVEWPVAITGKFDPRFLKLPTEVLVATLEGHQRYFPLADKQDQLLPAFITISNIESREPDRVREGNERVIRPRLADAEFFWQQDLEQSLDSHARRLESVVFEKRLGSVADKCGRIRELAVEMAEKLDIDTATVARAATLAKADLVTEMVGEFPELQGIMGSYYAREAGETDKVVAAIGEQYLPRHAGDELPDTGAGAVLALADRLDTLAGIFAIGRKPSGDKDPYALRRAAIGVLRIVVEKQLDLDLHQLMESALEAQPVSAAEGTLAALLDFMLERQRSWYLDRDIRHDVFDAVAGRGPTQPLDFESRLRAVQAFLDRPESEALTAANKRIQNILRQADSQEIRQIDPAQLQETSEKALFNQLETIRDKVNIKVANGEYSQALATLADLRDDIDTFFDEVMVMAEDEGVRNNRLALVAEVGALFMQIADLSRLQG